MKNRQIPKPFFYRICVIIIASLQLSTSAYSQKNIEFAVPASKGILVFAGMEITDKQKIASYSIERSADQKKWEKIAELRSPETLEAFSNGLKKWDKDFAFQSSAKINNLATLWEKCKLSGRIDSLGYWASLTSVRLAAGLAHYDQTVTKDTLIWYKVNKLDKDGKTISEQISTPVKYPFIPEFDKVTLVDNYVGKTFIYLKWESTGNMPAPLFIVRYYENEKLSNAEGETITYSVGNKKYYIYQDSIRYLKSKRFYFMNPIDIYGNKAVASDMELIEPFSLKQGYFANTNAKTDEKNMGIILNWQLNNSNLVESIDIYKSDSFDDKKFEKLITIPSKDTTYKDKRIIPDKMYYYYLVAKNKQKNELFKSGKFFNVAYDKLKPVYPGIRPGRTVENGAEIEITANEMNLAGVRIYRSNGISPKLYPITDILKLAENKLSYIDTSKSLMPGKTYLYAAKSINNSSVESIFSDTITIYPNIKTNPPSANQISAYEEDDCVKLVWENVRARHQATKGYKVYRREIKGEKFKLLLPKDSVVIVPLFTDKTALKGKTYEYAVQTVDDLGGVSESMAIASISVKPLVLPTPPKVWLSQINGKVSVEWPEINEKQNYKLNIYRYQRSKKPKLLKTLSLSETKYIDNKVKQGNLYFYYTTFSTDKNIESRRSQEIEIRIR